MALVWPCTVCFVLAFFHSALAREFVVGGRNGWVVPSGVEPETYNQWSGRIQFLIGDTLLFNYNPAEDSVLQVTAQQYDACNTSNPIASYKGGNTIFRLPRYGPFHFISGNRSNCQKGEKIIIVVLAPRNLAPAPTAASPGFSVFVRSPSFVAAPTPTPQVRSSSPSPAPVVPTPSPSSSPAPVVPLPSFSQPLFPPSMRPSKNVPTPRPPSFSQPLFPPSMRPSKNVPTPPSMCQHFTEESPSKEEKLLDLNEIFSPHCHFLSLSSNFSTDIPSAVLYPLTPASFAAGTNEWEDMCCVQRNIQHANSIIVADGEAEEEELSDKKQPGNCIDELGYLQQLTA